MSAPPVCCALLVLVQLCRCCQCAEHETPANPQTSVWRIRIHWKTVMNGNTSLLMPLVGPTTDAELGHHLSNVRSKDRYSRRIWCWCLWVHGNVAAVTAVDACPRVWTSSVGAAIRTVVLRAAGASLAIRIGQAVVELRYCVVIVQRSPDNRRGNCKETTRGEFVTRSDLTVMAPLPGVMPPG